MEIITAFTIYFGLYAPVSWKYTVGIMVSSQTYYFIFTYIVFETSRLSVAIIL